MYFGLSVDKQDGTKGKHWTTQGVVVNCHTPLTVELPSHRRAVGVPIHSDWARLSADNDVDDSIADVDDLDHGLAF